MFRTTLCLWLCSVAVLGQAADPFIGTWRMNPDKSRYEGRPKPISEIVRFRPENDSLLQTVERVNADKTVTKLTQHYRFDGVERPTENAHGETITRRRLDTRTHEGTFRRDKNVVTQDHWELSSDGNTIHRTLIGTQAHPSGKPFTFHIVYERAKDE
jgi:hypothetical protein